MIRRLGYLPIFGLAMCFSSLPTAFASADEPMGDDASAARDASAEGLDMRLAKTRLKLAEVELNRASEANERIPGSYTTITIDLLRRNVEIAKARLDALSGANETNFHAAHLRELEYALKIAELRWKSAVRLRERSLIDPSQVEALRLRAEVARLALARARDPEHVATPLDHIHWQLQQLRQQLLDLTLRVEDLANRN